jgi:lysophospholipase L1-like esterase
MSGERAKSTKTVLMTIGVAILILSASLLALYFENHKNSNSPIRVACVGDSITEITNYPADLQNMLGNGYKVGTFGVVGATVLLNTDRPYLNQTAFQEASIFKPNIVIIILGTNDARSNIFENSKNFESDYIQLVFGFQNITSRPKIFVAIPPPIFNNTLDLITANLVQGIIPQIQHVANELGLPTVNLYSQLITHPDYFPDGVHPDNTGANLIAQEAYNAIISLQKQS